MRWGIPMSFGSNLTALGDTMPWVSEQLKKVSGGTVNLQVFEPGKLVPPLAIFDSVSTGKVEAGYSWMGYEIGKVPVSALFGAVPFGMESPQFAALVESVGVFRTASTPEDLGSRIQSSTAAFKQVLDRVGFRME